MEELQTVSDAVQEQSAAARPDPRLQEELTKTEQRAREQEVKARELQARLRVLEEEQRELLLGSHRTRPWSRRRTSAWPT